MLSFSILSLTALISSVWIPMSPPMTSGSPSLTAVDRRASTPRPREGRSLSHAAGGAAGAARDRENPRNTRWDRRRTPSGFVQFTGTRHFYGWTKRRRQAGAKTPDAGG